MYAARADGPTQFAVTSYTFSERGSAQAVEEGAKLAPKFDADGLVTCVATDAARGDVLGGGPVTHGQFLAATRGWGRVMSPSA